MGEEKGHRGERGAKEEEEGEQETNVKGALSLQCLSNSCDYW